MKFIEKPANLSSISHRKIVHGVGINDAEYIITTSVNGKNIVCPYYRKWADMIKRCYCDKYQEIQPTYKDCYVCDSWLLFSNFKSWMEKQDWEGKELDKDILFQGNKIYSTKNCVFVSQAINSLMTNCKSSKGDTPQGVYLDKRDKRYSAKCRVDGKYKHLGMFGDPLLAFEAYKKFKYKVISDVAKKQSEPLRSALLAYRIT